MNGFYTEEIAKDSNTSPDMLRKILERGKDDVVSQIAAYNSNCSPDALKMVLERGKDDLVSRLAVRNPNCPPELLKMVLERRNDDFVSRYITNNPNCPPELLEMVLEREKDDFVSQYAADNPNCPMDAKIKWAMMTIDQKEKHVKLTNPSENDCVGIFGKLFGHKFEKRMDSKEGEGKWPFVEDSFESIMASSHNGEEKANIIYATKTIDETYIHDICTRCGKIIQKNV